MAANVQKNDKMLLLVAMILAGKRLEDIRRQFNVYKENPHCDVIKKTHTY